jgi:sporulation protein YlmC with PRC-barrel domain
MAAGRLKKVSEFQYARVEREDGKFLGHVFDLRSRGLPEHGDTREARVISELVYGKRGLLARLGLTHARATTVAWESVKEIKDGKIIVDNAVGQRQNRER